jgi:hypothetical protein
MVLVLLAPAVSAGKVYVGAGVGSSSAEIDGTSSRIDFGDTGYVGFVGYRVLRNVAAELSYTDFGSLSETVDGTSFDAELTVAALWAVGILPATPNLEIYGRLGWGSWDASVDTAAGSSTTTTDTDGGDLGYGIGFGYDFTPHFGIELDWAQYDLEDSGDVHFTGLCGRYRF